MFIKRCTHHFFCSSAFLVSLSTNSRHFDDCIKNFRGWREKGLGFFSLCQDYVTSMLLSLQRGSQRGPAGQTALVLL